MFYRFDQVATMDKRLRMFASVLSRLGAELGVTCGDDTAILSILVPDLEASSNGMLTRDIGSGLVKH